MELRTVAAFNSVILLVLSLMANGFWAILFAFIAGFGIGQFAHLMLFERER